MADPTAPSYVDSGTRGKIHLRWWSSPPHSTRLHVLYHIESYVNAHPLRPAPSSFQITFNSFKSHNYIVITNLSHFFITRFTFVPILCQQTAQDSHQVFLFAMKKRETNQVGELLLDHLKNHAVGLYDHLLSGNGDVDLVEKKLTNNINSHFIGGYSISHQNPLHHFMVDYDIIRILKEYVGYTFLVWGSDDQERILLPQLQCQNCLPWMGCGRRKVQQLTVQLSQGMNVLFMDCE